MNSRMLAQLIEEALVLHRAGRLDEAAVRYARVRSEDPGNFDAAHLAGTVELQLGRAEAAAELLEAARRLNPRSAVCAMRLGVALNALGRAGAAEAALRESVTLDPSLPEGWFHLGRALEQLGRMEDAAHAAGRAAELRPDYAEAIDHLGAMLAATRGHAAAEPHFRRAVGLDPKFARAWCNLGICLVYKGAITEAIACFDRALRLDPQMHHAYAGRGLALERCHRIAEAVDDYGRAASGDPRDFQARSARLMALHYLDGVPRALLWKEHREFGEAVSRVQGAVAHDFQPDDPGRRLRVAFLSPNFRAHSVAHFFEPLLANLDRQAFETFLYHDHARTDEVSERLRSLACHWRHVAGLTDRSLESVLRADRPDILVDLAGHTELNRMALLSRRLARVQATYLGYPDTTGLAAMDFRITDTVADPEGEAERFATETLVRIGATAWSYSPPDDAPEPGPGPASGGGPVTFGCFNNFAKVTDRALSEWGRLLRQVPGSRLLIKGAGLGSAALVAAARSRMEAAGMNPGSVDLLERIPAQAGHLAAYGRVDISLDTFPYHGTTTTCEALWMGVPVVTLAGDRHSSRVGASLLRAVGRAEWIARDWDDYVDKAAALAADPRQLAVLRGALRDEFRRSPLFDHAGQGARFGDALRAMWRARCGAAEAAGTLPEKQPPAFTVAPVFTMRTLGSNGRFANQVFQYLFLRICADQRGAGVQTPAWVGQRLFGISDPAIASGDGAVMREDQIADPGQFLNSDRWIGGSVDFVGWFQFHTRHYRPHREFIRRLLAMKADLRPTFAGIFGQLRKQGRPIVAVHLRRGDYGEAQFFRAPARWYAEWLGSAAAGLGNPIVYLCSETPAPLAAHFQGFQVFHAGMVQDFPAALAFALDFYMMTRSDALAISNSSFSFLAAMLNEKAHTFVRPTLEGRTLEAFDPWDAPVLLERRLKPGEQEELDAVDAVPLPAVAV